MFKMQRLEVSGLYDISMSLGGKGLTTERCVE
jgi:hypothetical protein